MLGRERSMPTCRDNLEYAPLVLKRHKKQSNDQWRLLTSTHLKRNSKDKFVEGFPISITVLFSVSFSMKLMANPVQLRSEYWI